MTTAGGRDRTGGAKGWEENVKDVALTPDTVITEGFEPIKFQLPTAKKSQLCMSRRRHASHLLIRSSVMLHVDASTDAARHNV